MPPFSKMSGGSGPRRAAGAAGGEVVFVVVSDIPASIIRGVVPDSRAGYRVREATIDDMDVLVRHRIAMFEEMGRAFDAPLIDQMFRAWLRPMMIASDYRGWLCETDSGDVAAGAGMTLIKWPP